MIWKDVAFGRMVEPIDLQLALANVFGVDASSVFVIDDVESFPDDYGVVALLACKDGQFPMIASIFLAGFEEASCESDDQDSVRLTSLSKQLQARLLTDSVSSSPYVFRQFNPDGSASVVSVDPAGLDDLDQLNVVSE
jgi:hypothetical protein